MMKGYIGVYKMERDVAAIFPEGGGQGMPIEIPDVRIDGVVGSGANGIVFSGLDVLDRQLAVKVYPPRLDKDRDIDEIYGQALLEARKVASLKHPAIATIYRYSTLGGDWGFYDRVTEDNWPYSVMEYRSGDPLKEVLPKLKDNVNARRSILRRIFDALAYAEARGSLHGDLHDGNVLVEAYHLNGRVDIADVSLIDFGTSIFAGRERSEARHARLLRSLSYQLLPELNAAFVPTPRLAQRTGFLMLPCLSAALKLYDELAPSEDNRTRLPPRMIGAQLAGAVDFDLNVLWAALKPQLDKSSIGEVKKGLLEYLTHEHALAQGYLDDATLAIRLEQELKNIGAETEAILGG
jgi:serine/threonine protein kinase